MHALVKILETFFIADGNLRSSKRHLHFKDEKRLQSLIRSYFTFIIYAGYLANGINDADPEVSRPTQLSRGVELKIPPVY